MIFRKLFAAGGSLRAVCPWIACAVLIGALCPLVSEGAAPTRVHGLWVWKTPSVLGMPSGAEGLRDYCQSQDINEVYASVSARWDATDQSRLAHLIDLLHGSSVKVEALLSSTDADEPGEHRDSLLRRVQAIVQFNQQHPADRFDGIHLDIEPQQRPENKGAGNLQFLPGLTDAFRAVRELADPVGMTVNADIQSKLLKGDVGQRRMLLSAVPRVTLMMYELSGSGDGSTDQQKAAIVETASRKFLELAFAGLDDPDLARMAIALRTPDYGDSLPQMLQKLDDANGANPHFLGWARHSYNDMLDGSH